jgi:predicted nucleic acid-binding protein
MLVIDASVALGWLFEDERHAGALAVLERVAESRATVPAHWWLEVGNALLVARRRRRLQRDPDEMLSALRALPILVDAESALLAATATFALASKSGLSTYDAAYLELAQRLDLPLATLDTELGAAARAAGVPLAIKA